MRNIRLTIEYDGSRYQGWSRLGKNESTNTISNKILDVIKKMSGEDVELFCGMRTEVGVHAYRQLANFKTSSRMDLTEMQRYLNRYLPMDIAITDIEEMPERFHAQLNAKRKVYVYRMITGAVPSVFDRKYAYHCFRHPDKELMDEAADLLIGKHDFRNFTSAGKSKSTVKEIYNIEIYADPEEMQITIEANDFLHNMQRLIIGTLIDIGLEKRPVSDIRAIFRGEESASLPCDPKGMYLQEIQY